MIEMSLQVHRLTAAQGVPEAWSALYESAFPVEERRDLAWQHRALADADFHCTELQRDGAFVGLLTYWLPEGASFLYVEHLAVLPECRGQGVGSAALSWLAAQASATPILLEIEPPEDTRTRRRLDFYERNGYTLLLKHHLQWPYHPQSPAVPLKLMARGAVDDALVGAFEDYLHTRVMAWRPQDCRC